VHKLQSDKDLLAAINDLLSGRIHVPGWLVDGDADQSKPTHSVDTPIAIKQLTPRQSGILPLIAQGMSNKEISSHLKIAEGTTKIHIAALIRALGARNRTEAAFIAAKLVGSSERSKDQFKKLGPRFNLRNTIRG
jgi:DNA-binding NarL/FixJ family response regulator